ncbi:O-antigen ligase family protein [Solidesulfovibrio sp.]|uniref:O-antigen ligase family protein n=1 Tax=Solidesulfovibrio sp. TaxID=2910990 RepID=UPI00261A6F81|nr:O-antigen ligase family protein [Solidesulfovibrio sp.]
MGINSLLGLFGSMTFSQPWVMTVFFLLFYIALGCLAIVRPVAAMVMYFGTSIMNPQASYPIFMGIPLAKITAGMGLAVCLLNVRRLNFRFPLTMMTMAAFLVMACVSALAAVQPELAEKRLDEFLKVGLLTMLTVWAMADRKDYSFFFWGIVACLSYDILKSLVETQTRQAWVGIQGVAGWINDSNDWALALAMGLPLFYVALALHWHRGWKARILFGLAAIGGLLTLTLTYSRGGFLAAAMSGLVFLLLDRKPWRAVWVGCLMVLVVSFYMPGSYVDRVESIFGLGQQAESAWERPSDDPEEYNGTERVYYWRIAYEVMRENPLKGVGWGNFVKEYERRLNTTEGFVAHSTWFQVGAEAGEITLFLYAMMIVLTLVATFRAYLRARRAGDAWAQLHCRGVIAGIIAFCVGGSFLSRENSELLFVYIAMAAVLSGLVPRALPSPASRAADLTAGAAVRGVTGAVRQA